MENIMKTVLLAACVATTFAASPTFAKDSGSAALRGCVQTGVAASVTVWLTSILAAPFTGGTSLIAPLFSDQIVVAGVIGCAAGAAGEAAAEETVDKQ
jgi:type III secretory pathway component EscT